MQVSLSRGAPVRFGEIRTKCWADLDAAAEVAWRVIRPDYDSLTVKTNKHTECQRCRPRVWVIPKRGKPAATNERERAMVDRAARLLEEQGIEARIILDTGRRKRR
ncbi:MAG: hypothetical protein AB7P76_11690 [Candidatus Melainabacteria bacterium]